MKGLRVRLPRAAPWIGAIIAAVLTLVIGWIGRRSMGWVAAEAAIFGVVMFLVIAGLRRRPDG